MSDLPGLPGEPTEPVPNQLRILAMMQNLGTLRSIHRPASWFANLQFRNGRIYLFDQGFVLGLAGGDRLSLFRRGQFTLRKVGGSYLVTGADGRRMSLSRKWSDFAELEQAIVAGAATGATHAPDSAAAPAGTSAADSSAAPGASSAADVAAASGSTSAADSAASTGSVSAADSLTDSGATSIPDLLTDLGSSPAPDPGVDLRTDPAATSAPDQRADPGSSTNH